MNIHNQIVYVVIAILALALSSVAVATEVGLKTAKQSPKYATQIVVGNNGSRYDRVLTSTIPIQVQYRAACKS